MITELNERSRTIFRYIVDTYLATGSPVGSRTISQASGLHLSPASIRNTMADLEDNGLLYAPHISAGRLPTEQGIKLYIEGLMQLGGLDKQQRAEIDSMCSAAGRPVNEVLEQTSQVLSGLSSCASLVIAPKTKGTLKQIQFVQLAPRKILAIIVMQSGLVENRVFHIDEDLPPSALISAANYLNAKICGQTIEDAEQDIRSDIQNHKSQLDSITQRLVEQGLALAPSDKIEGRMIIRGQSHLLNDLKAIEDLQRAQTLLTYLEEQNNMLSLLETVHEADGVQIFIGAENDTFDQVGWSIIISPYKNLEEKIIGAVGVIGPMRLNYDRIIPMVDYTSKIVGKIVDDL